MRGCPIAFRKVDASVHVRQSEFTGDRIENEDVFVSAVISQSPLAVHVDGKSFDQHMVLGNEYVFSK